MPVDMPVGTPGETEGEAPVEAGSSRRSAGLPTVAGVIVIVLLCAVCLLLAFRGGAYPSSTWLPLLIGTAALAVVISVSGPPVCSSHLQKVILGLFALQAAWTVASILWAGSMGNAWEEANRTFFYVIGTALTFVAVRWSGRLGLRMLAVLVTGVVGVMAAVMVVRLGLTSKPLDLFIGGRLNYPVTYFNGLACLLMIGFWLALGLANAAGTEPAGDGAPDRSRTGSTRFPRWTQPVLLAVSVCLFELALLPQSRGALWTFFLVVPFFVILSPNRFRALVDLVVVMVPVALFWTRLNGVYVAIRDETPLEPALAGALEAIGYSVVIVLVAWAVTWLVERSVAPLSRRPVVWIGVALIVVATGVTAGGLVIAQQRTGGLDDYVRRGWTEFVSDTGKSDGTGGRFSALGLNGRLAQWKVAGKAFTEHPLLGVGAQNFEVYYFQHRKTLLEVKQPHSQPMQLLAELGLPGLLLWSAFIILTFFRTVVLRFRSSNRATQAVMAAMMTAVISWLIHSSADWLWQLAAVSLPVMMLLGGLAGSVEERSRCGLTAHVASDGPERPAKWGRVLRPVAVVLSLLVIVSAALPYLSLRYSARAAGAGVRHSQAVLAGTETAIALDPTTTFPYAVRAAVHTAAADQAPEGSATRVEELRLAAAAWVDATEVEPEGWLYFCKAGEAFLAVREAVRNSSLGPAGVGVEELTRSAHVYLAEARRLNPLSPQLDALEKML